VRQIFRIDVRPAHNDDRITLVEVEGDKFLYNMVRIIVGTLIDIGRERRPKDALVRALASHARTDLGITAPPDGLCLERVIIDEASVSGEAGLNKLVSWPPAH
jgi:tRNA pseudouridine38-40 synthase